ncbi:MAG: zinc ribbon domain-containing protein [Methanobacterium sp.]|nr:zinc ribbon domain-containing protein [Methanobacterium sp.]
MVEEQSPASNICPKCSTDNNSSSRFCKECGTPQTEDTTTIRKPVTPHKREDPMESLKESDKGIMEDIGGFIDKATSSLEGERESHESTPGDGLSINEMITEEEFQAKKREIMNR